jgi:hypothetical protein
MNAPKKAPESPVTYYLNTRTPWSNLPENLPQDWLEPGDPARVKYHLREKLPIEVRVGPEGAIGASGTDAHSARAPFRFCLRCGTADAGARSASDFSRLATDGSEGRSTATTILSFSTVRHLRKDEALRRAARKLLSLTAWMRRSAPVPLEELAAEDGEWNAVTVHWPVPCRRSARTSGACCSTTSDASWPSRSIIWTKRSKAIAAALETSVCGHRGRSRKTSGLYTRRPQPACDRLRRMDLSVIAWSIWSCHTDPDDVPHITEQLKLTDSDEILRDLLKVLRVAGSSSASKNLRTTRKCQAIKWPAQACVGLPVRASPFPTIRFTSQATVRRSPAEPILHGLLPHAAQDGQGLEAREHRRKSV